MDYSLKDDIDDIDDISMIDYYHKKTNQDIRTNYNNNVSRLIAENTVTKNYKYRRIITIYDWDDTLLCTTQLRHINFSLDKVQLMKDNDLLDKLDEQCVNLLTTALIYGDTYIITNACLDWVNKSSMHLLPNTNKLLLERNIIVISAREVCQENFLNDDAWKSYTFTKLADQYDKNISTNIICIGDSNKEMEAGKELSLMLDANIKTIKFKDNPNVKELIKQQRALIEKIDKLYFLEGNLTIRMLKTK